MNHLAHSFLSCDDQDLLMGNMLTDFVSKPEADAIHDDFQKGILLHRAIDKFMDTHPTTKEAIKILRPTQKKYAPVSIDLLWDFYLTKNWKKYAPQAYDDFCVDIYKMLAASLPKLPVKLQAQFNIMMEHQFLGQYMEEWRFEKVLMRMEKRTKFKSNFTVLTQVSKENEFELNQLFNAYFPEVIKMSHQYCNC